MATRPGIQTERDQQIGNHHARKRFALPLPFTTIEIAVSIANLNSLKS